MSRFVRASKYRHLYGQPAKKEQSYDNIKVSASAWDTNLVSANPKYIAVNYQSGGGGAFLVAPLSSPGKLPDIYPLVRAHAAPVLDTAWSPFDDGLIASAGEDGRVALTRIDSSSDDLFRDAWLAAEGDKKAASGAGADIEPIVKLSGHGRKVGHVLWHPSASNVLVSASNDIKVWDVSNTSNANAVLTLQAHPDMVQSISFNPTGALLATTCRDKKLRIFDVRAGSDPVAEGDSHSGVKGSRVCWLGAGAGAGNRIVTTGFSKMSDRQVFLWDAGAIGGKRLKELSIDTSSGTLMPFWSDNNVLFLAGKGDGNIRYYEYENDELFYLTEHKSSDPQRGMCFLPRRGLNTADNEIMRAFKVGNNVIEPISFIVPRKSDQFQSDIYPDAPSEKAALSASEFFSGKTSTPILCNLETRKDTGAAPISAAFVAPSAPSRQTSVPTPTPTASAPAPAPAQAPTPAAAAAPAAKSPTPTSATSNGRGFSLLAAKADEDWDAAPAATSSPSAGAASVRSPPPPSASPVEQHQPQPAAAAAVPARTLSSSSASNGNGDSAQVSQLQSENANLKQEVGEQRKHIRELELEIESMRAKLDKISKAIL